MKIEIEESSGFCFGVENAIKLAEETLASGEVVYCLGQIVHNEIEVERLEKLGLVTIDHRKFSELKDCKVLIRAHGEPPETYEIAEKNNIRIIEATCPIVKKLQNRVHNAWLSSSGGGGQVAIFGKAGHAEVEGLLGQTKGEAILVTGKEDLELIDYSLPVTIFSQTTMSIKDYEEIVGMLKDNYRAVGKTPDKMVFITRSICGQVSNREPALIDFAKKHDVIIFVSGKKSSNGKMLYEVCKRENNSSYFITSYDEIDTGWFTSRDSIGLCGATSTPRWLIREIFDKLKELFSA